MRKLRWMSWVLILCLLWSGCALGDGAIPDIRTTPAAAGGFSFRGGVIWGMSPQEVQAVETTPMIERTQTEWAVLYTQSRVTVSRYEADLVYMFYQSQLQMITYDFGADMAVGAYPYLQGALSAVYGDAVDVTASDVVSLMDRIYPGYYTIDRLTKVSGWAAADGTMIYLYAYAQDAYAILYASGAITGGQGFDTTGL